MLKRNLFFLCSVTVVALASIILSVFNYNPYTAHNYQMVIFYASAFIFLFGLFSLIIFYTKIGLSKKETIYALYWPSIRQGILLSSAVISLLVLRGMKLFDLWVGIPLFLILILFELFFQTKRKIV